MSTFKIRAFIFDMDGTMIDSMPYHRMALAEFARKHGVTMDLNEIMRRTTGRTGVESMSDIFERQLPLDVATAYIHEKEALYRELFAPHLREVAGFKAFMRKACEAGLACAVGTAGDAANVAFVFSHLFAGADAELAPRVVIRGDMGLAGKPEPAIFLRAASDLGFEPHECVVFEDAPLGIEAARRAGMQAVALTTTNTVGELAGAHVLAAAPNFQHLLDLNFLDTLTT